MSAEANHTDRYGMPVATNSGDALAHFQEGLDLALSQNYGAEEAFAKATEADEGFAVAHADLAFMDFIRIAVPEAKAGIAKAQELAPGLSVRERQHIDIVDKFVNGENRAATNAVLEHLQEFPGDAMLLRLAQRLYIQGCGATGSIGLSTPVLRTHEGS